MDGPGPTQFLNLEGLAEIEWVKHLRVTGQTHEAYQEAVEGASHLFEARRDFQAGGTGRCPGRTMFALCRNEYLLLREAIKIWQDGDDGSDGDGRVDWRGRAMDVCVDGLNCVNGSYSRVTAVIRSQTAYAPNLPTLQTYAATPADVCEMGRCMAESLYIQEQYRTEMPQDTAKNLFLGVPIPTAVPRRVTFDPYHSIVGLLDCSTDTECRPARSTNTT